MPRRSGRLLGSRGIDSISARNCDLTTTQPPIPVLAPIVASPNLDNDPQSDNPLDQQTTDDIESETRYIVIAPEIMKGHKGESIYIRSWLGCQLEREKKTRTGVGHLRSPKNAIRFGWYVWWVSKVSNSLVTIWHVRLTKFVGGGWAQCRARPFVLLRLGI